MSWTDERIERLKTMWANGATASQIADDLGGVSRNAVIGKAHRLGLEQRPSPVKHEEEKEANKSAPAEVAAPVKAAPAPKAAEAKPAAPAPAAAPAATPHPTGRRPSAHDLQYRSIGPGGFVRQGPGDQQAPIPPAPPRRSGSRQAQPGSCRQDQSARAQRPHLQMADWPSGRARFSLLRSSSQPRFPVLRPALQNAAYQAQLPRRDRRPPPPLPFGGPRVR